MEGRGIWWMAFGWMDGWDEDGWMDGIRMDGWDEDGWMNFHVDRIEW